MFTIPTRPAKLTRYCLTKWISKLPGSFEIHWERQYLVHVSLFGIKYLLRFEISLKFKSNLYVGPVNIFPNSLLCHATALYDVMITLLWWKNVYRINTLQMTFFFCENRWLLVLISMEFVCNNLINRYITHICVSKTDHHWAKSWLVVYPVRQAIIWTDVGLLLIRLLQTNSIEIWTKIQRFS